MEEEFSFVLIQNSFQMGENNKNEKNLFTLVRENAMLLPFISGMAEQECVCVGRVYHKKFPSSFVQSWNNEHGMLECESSGERLNNRSRKCVKE